MKSKTIATAILATLLIVSAFGTFATEDYGITNHQHKDRLLQIPVDEKIIYIVPDDYSDYESLKLLNDTIKKAYPKIKEKNY